MIDINAEKLLPLNDVPKNVPVSRSGKALSFAAVWRWATTGLKTPDGGRVRLEVVKLGGRLLTSREALQRFADAQTAAMPGNAPTAPSRTPGKRTRASEAAAAKLEAAGI